MEKISRLLTKFVAWYRTPTGILSAACIGTVVALALLGFVTLALLLSVAWIGVVLPYKLMLERRDWTVALQASAAANTDAVRVVERRMAELASELGRLPTAEEVRNWQVGVEAAQKLTNESFDAQLEELQARQEYAFFERSALAEATEGLVDLVGVANDQEEVSREVQTLTALYSSLAPQVPLPRFSDDTISAAAALALVNEVRRRSPGLTVLIGAGEAAIVTALAVSQNDVGSLTVLEHDLHTVGRTQSELADRGLEKVATVLHLPLTEVRFDSAEHLWFDLPADWDESPIETLIISARAPDGAGFSPEMTVPLLAPQLVSQTSVLVYGGNANDLDTKNWREAYELRLSSGADDELKVFRF